MTVIPDNDAYFHGTLLEEHLTFFRNATVKLSVETKVHCKSCL